MINGPALQLASRIDAGLRQLLGEGIDLSRMVSDGLYRRDVLLVCDACAPGELATLAGQLRAALVDQAQAALTVRRAQEHVEPDKREQADLPHAPSGPDSGGFSPSRFFNSLFGAWMDHGASGPDSALHHGKARQRGGWFGR